MVIYMRTEVVKIDSPADDADKIKSAAGLLDSGGLVAFPTETVYGIACAARADAINRLDRVKGRTAGKYYTLHIPDRPSVGRYVPKIPPRGRKLVEKAWPGPLTAVFQLDRNDLGKQSEIIDTQAFDILYHDGTVGIRCPDNEIAQKLLTFAAKPIIAPSANLTGRAPAVNAEQVMAEFNGKIDLILDGSQCKYKNSSTVVKITPNDVKILRQGVYSEAEIAEMSLMRILFVCTGNTCRSPMAEFFCRKFLSEKLNCDIDKLEQMGYKVTSSGVMDAMGFGTTGEVVEICRQKGIDATGHRNRTLTTEQIEQSDYIYVMTRGHRDRILELSPAAASKCKLLDENGAVADPIGGDIEVYKRCAQHIEKALKIRISEIWHEDSGSK